MAVKQEKVYLAIIMGLQTIDKLKFTKLWDKALAIKVALDNAGLKIVRKPKKDQI